MENEALLEQVKYNADGLVTAIAQDRETNEILMVAYMNETSLRQTLETGIMTYWSRSRQKIWVKGESSGNLQEVREIRIDCDGDALLFKVKQVGGSACHTGHYSCFYRKLEDGKLVETGTRLFDPAEVYRK